MVTGLHLCPQMWATTVYCNLFSISISRPSIASVLSIEALKMFSILEAFILGLVCLELLGKLRINLQQMATALSLVCWSLRPTASVCVCAQLEECEYKPLDPKDIRLPPPMPPSDRLLAAVEAFYSPPSHDRPRNRYLTKNVKINQIIDLSDGIHL